MKFLNGCAKRQQEKPGLYDDPKEVDAFVGISKGGVVGFFENRFVAMILKKFGPTSSLRVLDLGTGPGWIPVKLAKARPQWEITGLDASSLMLSLARQHAEENGVKLETVEAKAEKMPFPANHFDLIISHLAFSEFPEEEAVMQEIERILKPSGTVIIADLLRPPRWQMPLLIAWRYLSNPFGRGNHQFIDSLRGAMTREELNALFQKSNLIFSLKVSNKWAGGHGCITGLKRGP